MRPRIIMKIDYMKKTFIICIALLICFICAEMPWAERVRNYLEELLPGLSFIIYLGLFIILTVVIAVIFKLGKRIINKRESKEFGVFLRGFGWDFPEFTIESGRSISRFGGLFGNTYGTYEYVLRFKKGLYYIPNSKNVSGMDPYYECQTDNLHFEIIDDRRVKVTIDYEYNPS